MRISHSIVLALIGCLVFSSCISRDAEALTIDRSGKKASIAKKQKKTQTKIKKKASFRAINERKATFVTSRSIHSVLPGETNNEPIADEAAPIRQCRLEGTPADLSLTQYISVRASDPGPRPGCFPDTNDYCYEDRSFGDIVGDAFLAATSDCRRLITQSDLVSRNLELLDLYCKNSDCNRVAYIGSTCNVLPNFINIETSSRGGEKTAYFSYQLGIHATCTSQY